jgi:hypothetical protein
MTDKTIILNNFKQLIKQIKIDIDRSTGKENLKNLYRLKSIELATKIIEKYPHNNINIGYLEKIKGIGPGTIK